MTGGGDMKITFIGHSAFALEADTYQVLIDPFITGNPAATVEIARRSSAKVIATAELANWIGSQGVDGATGANHGGTIPFSGGSTKFVPAWHTSSYSTVNGVVAHGVPAGHIVRFGGK